MRKYLFGAVFSVGLLLFGLAGCSRSGSQPPPPLAVEQIPTEMNKAFAKAPADVKDVVNQLNTTLGAKDYVAASQAIQTLFNLPVATKDQRMVTVRSMLTINSLLQTAQAQGDQKAAAVLSEQRRLK